MAYRIDQIVLWMFAIFSAFFLMLTLTNGQVLLSVIGTFIGLLFLRLLTQSFLSDKRYISRSKRIEKIHQLLYSWIFIEESEMFQQLHAILPGYFQHHDFILIRRMPTNCEFNANELLELWAYHKKESIMQLRVLITCPLSKDARNLLPRLTCPVVHVVDSAELTRELLKNFQKLPEEFVKNVKKEQCDSLLNRITLFVQTLRPLRICMYLCFFTGMYLMTDSVFYLISTISAILLLALRTAVNRLRFR